VGTENLSSVKSHLVGQGRATLAACHGLAQSLIETLTRKKARQGPAYPPSHREKTRRRFGHSIRPQRRETIAAPATPSTRAAPVDKSMQRPFTNGPRSFIRTVTLRPVECEVTMT